ncbi:MAG: hypothetical protein KDK91_28590 [Gammaproteobacteria bacterium]|nr:hypothetical protein [Gammaproteobacteria bacterium]
MAPVLAFAVLPMRVPAADPGTLPAGGGSNTAAPETAAQAAPSPTAGDDTAAAGRTRLIEQKVRLLDTLLQRARARHELGDEARATLDIAQRLIDSVRHPAEQSDPQQANASLGEALRLIGEVSRHLARPSAQAERQRYESLRATLDGLVHSYQLTLAARPPHGEQPAATLTTSEPPDPTAILERQAAAILEPQVLQQALDRAAARAAQDDPVAATRILAEIYQPLVEALARLRAHETVSHRLVFETPQAELDYELQRLRSNHLLVQLMVEERAPSASRRQEIDADVENARRLEEICIEQRAAGDLGAAIRSAEGANQHLSRALRKTGIYVGQ